MDVFMKCGCVAQGTDGETGEPVCVIHDTYEIIDEPCLEGRMAECSPCGKQVPSKKTLPFFKYRGPGSEEATEKCICGFYRQAHPTEGQIPGKKYFIKCRNFNPQPRDTDEYYCGCRGWD